jgi:hypothetical protein
LQPEILESICRFDCLDLRYLFHFFLIIQNE